AGLAFELSGFMIGWLPLPTLISSAAWLPLSLALLERARRSSRARPAALAGLALGMSSLAGHPQIFYYVGLTVATVGGLRLLPGRWPALLLCLSIGGLVA